MISIPQSVQSTIRRLTEAGFSAYAVGGSVRDTLLGRPTHGWDFTTNAKPDQIVALFPDSFYDNQFGTVGIKLKNGDELEDVYEITTYRSEKGYSDHRHPDVLLWGASLEEDLSRRDFTINAIATDGKNIIDPYGGQEDLAKKLIRSVGDAKERFAEDALRMMRAVRIGAQLGFLIEKNTAIGIQKTAHTLPTISQERIHDELIKILASPYAADGILLLKNTGLLSYILPELEQAFTIGQKSPKRHHIYDVGTHSVMAMKLAPTSDPIVRLATLLHDIGKVKTYALRGDVVTFYNHEVVGYKMVKSILARLRFSNKDTERILTLVRWHQFTVDERQTDSALRRFIRHVGKDNVEDMLALRIGDRLGGGARETSWRLELFKKRLIDVQKQPFTVADLKISGHDVMKTLGIKPGPKVGEMLAILFSEVENGQITNDPEALLSRLRALA